VEAVLLYSLLQHSIHLASLSSPLPHTRVSAARAPPASPAQPAPGDGGLRAPPPRESPQEAAVLCTPTSPALSPARAPASRAPNGASDARD
jgi:hypothetical protein